MRFASIHFALIAGLVISLSFSCDHEPDIDQEILQALEYEVSERRLNAPSNFFGRSGEYLEWETENLLELVEDAITSFPPSIQEPIVRHMAMLMLDAVFHDVEAPYRTAVQNYHHRRTLKALEEIENTEVGEGAMIWKLYNMGVIVRTKTVTIGFDLTGGYTSCSEGFTLGEDIMKAIVDQCDVLFISHRHRDHAEEPVAWLFLDQGKPVITPPEVWEGMQIHNEITHFDRKAHQIQTLPVQSGEHELQVVVYPGHQGTQTQNNELGHSIDHREAYALNYSRWDVPYPKGTMTWGESYHYIP